MKFECGLCHKTFLHPGILRTAVDDANRSVMMGPIAVQGDSLETHVCPYCKSLDIAEYVEVEAQPESVKQVPVNQVDEWLAKGYKVVGRYAKEYNLEKYPEPKVETLKEYADAAQKTADVSNQTLKDAEK
jgi:hypothetical protein